MTTAEHSSQFKMKRVGKCVYIRYTLRHTHHRRILLQDQDEVLLMNFRGMKGSDSQTTLCFYHM